MGYSHVGTFLYINTKREIDTDIAWWYRFVDSVSGILEKFGDRKLDSVEDHAIGHYVRALPENIDFTPHGL
jgi:carbon monoxide dehydrogenase subunit G